MDQTQLQEEILRYRAIKKYFKIFMTEVLGFTNAEFQDQIDDVISNPIYRKIAIAIARNHGKSTHLSVGYPLWEMALNHNLRFKLISSTATVASSFLTEITNHLEGNDEYRYWSRWVDPNHKGVIPKKREITKKEEKWSGNAITIERSGLTMKDPTVESLGVFGSILSKRADRVIGDDIVNQENSETYEQREKIKSWMDNTVLPLLNFDQGGRFIYLGNTWHSNDYMMQLLGDPQMDFKLKLPAVLSDAENTDLWNEYIKIRLDESLSLEDRMKLSEEFYQNNIVELNKGVKLLWPQFFSYKQFYLEKISNPFAYARMRQCDPSLRPNQKFKDEWLERMKVPYLRLSDAPPSVYTIHLCADGVDLAISEKESADDSVVLTLDRVQYGDGNLINPGDYVVRSIWRGKKTPNQVKEKIKTDYYVKKPAGIRVESVGYQMAIVRDLGDDTIPVTAYFTGGEKLDPDIGINSLATLAELGKLKVPYDPADPTTRTLVGQLLEEMRSWPDGHTGDTLMALWFAHSEIRDQTADTYTVPSLLGARDVAHPAAEEIRNLTPEQMKEAEKKADKAAILESEHERSLFNQMMRRR